MEEIATSPSPVPSTTATATALPSPQARAGPIGMQTYELINLCVGATLFAISLTGLAIALAKRSFPPIKAKSPHLVALALLANIAFWIGKLHAHGFIGYGGILQNCTLWGIWVQCVLGVCLMNAVLSLRYQRLYTVLILRQSAWNLRTYVPSILYAFVVLVCAVLSSAMPERMGFYWDEQSRNCFSTAASMYLFLPCVVIGVTTLALLTWRLRRVRDAFNEYRETRYGVILLLVAVAINAVLMATGYGRYRWAKHVLVVISFLWGNLYFWMVMGKPIYGYLFDRHRCQERFVAGLEIDTCQYMDYTRTKSDSRTKMATAYGWDSPTDRSLHRYMDDPVPPAHYGPPGRGSYGRGHDVRDIATTSARTAARTVVLVVDGHRNTQPPVA
ncbi:hypothetical protein SYNPS1DRAFT_22607 [Syncephalis pseudoplumigaleata]|uniref:G-protein coupled receptors family 3 profile domain-containing protein n=1 Tax=Syncephalis pseudoplumigaleata TaxID=1712513 RepID=A0A4P9Z1X3_9FUNG|nr:hypothetical protein SYNPS1DRAFT_22607 [Syncephalis pseudoplumigaleata]|eukprot:RKP25430.1 hypothetical protein SYNPS1DRAFT_22607 [Syncephalis pseudoplumigaleata]